MEAMIEGPRPVSGDGDLVVPTQSDPRRPGAMSRTGAAVRAGAGAGEAGALRRQTAPRGRQVKGLPGR
jgi:hypothetical protein